MAGVTPEKLRVVLDFVRFRIATAVGAVLAVLALLLPTWWTWFSVNPALPDPPAALVNHWNLWSVVANGSGDVGFSQYGGLGPTAPLSVTPPLEFGMSETNLGFAVLLCVILTLIALVVTAVRASWTGALAVAICATAAFTFEAILRAVGDGEHSGSNGPALYISGNGMAAAQWIAAAVVIWAAYVAVVARRDWRVRDGLLVALADAQ